MRLSLVATLPALEMSNYANCFLFSCAGYRHEQVGENPKCSGAECTKEDNTSILFLTLALCVSGIAHQVMLMDDRSTGAFCTQQRCVTGVYQDAAPGQEREADCS